MVHPKSPIRSTISDASTVSIDALRRGPLQVRLPSCDTLIVGIAVTPTFARPIFLRDRRSNPVLCRSSRHRDDVVRGMVCRLHWLLNGLVINSRQFWSLAPKCQSSINGSQNPSSRQRIEIPRPVSSKAISAFHSETQNSMLSLLQPPRLTQCAIERSTSLLTQAAFIPELRGQIFCDDKEASTPAPNDGLNRTLTTVIHSIVRELVHHPAQRIEFDS
jgi:hypothetical protein